MDKVREKEFELGALKLLVIRRSPHELLNNDSLNKVLQDRGVKHVESHAQSESDGNITISIIYR